MQWKNSAFLAAFSTLFSFIVGEPVKCSAIIHGMCHMCDLCVFALYVLRNGGVTRFYYHYYCVLHSFVLPHVHIVVEPTNGWHTKRNIHQPDIVIHHRRCHVYHRFMTVQNVSINISHYIEWSILFYWRFSFPLCALGVFSLLLLKSSHIRNNEHQLHTDIEHRK